MCQLLLYGIPTGELRQRTSHYNKAALYHAAYFLETIDNMVNSIRSVKSIDVDAMSTASRVLTTRVRLKILCFFISISIRLLQPDTTN